MGTKTAGIHPTPRQPRIAADHCFFTCHTCHEITGLYFTYELDGVTHCGKCFDEMRYGAAKRVCFDRGYHVTNSHNAIHRGKNEAGIEMQGGTVYCECNATAEYETPLNQTPAHKWAEGDFGKCVPIP